jgi:hypothetical protein
MRLRLHTSVLRDIRTVLTLIFINRWEILLTFTMFSSTIKGTTDMIPTKLFLFVQEAIFQGLQSNKYVREEFLWRR